MFVESIEKVQGFTRPIHTIIRLYGRTDVEPGASTLFFVNELGHAVTCKHVAVLIGQAEDINKKYQGFKSEKEGLPTGGKYNRRLKELVKKYHYSEKVIIQIKNNFRNCVDKITHFTIDTHPTEDLAVIKFEGFEKIAYQGYATFLKDSSKIKQGKSVCRLGYPFPEFTNYRYDPAKDDIEWTREGQQNTPRFPFEGMVTRNLLNPEGAVTGIEVSTPGLKGQSGGPLFDERGIVYGMQSKTHHLHLGFDIKGKEIREEGKIKRVSNHPFLHLGACVHVDVIKNFLKDKGVKYYEDE